jgi:hypothetical protein
MIFMKNFHNLLRKIFIIFNIGNFSIGIILNDFINSSGQLLAKEYVPQAPASSKTFGKPSYLDERINKSAYFKN